MRVRRLLIDGIASIFDFDRPHAARHALPRGPQQAAAHDRDRLAEDWRRIGDDLRAAMGAQPDRASRGGLGRCQRPD